MFENSTAVYVDLPSHSFQNGCLIRSLSLSLTISKSKNWMYKRKEKNHMWVKEWKVNNLTTGLVSIGRIGGTLGRIFNVASVRNQNFPISAPACAHCSNNSRRSCQLLLTHKITNTQQNYSSSSLISSQIQTPESIHLLSCKQRLPKLYSQLRIPNSNSKWIDGFVNLDGSTNQ